jgi:hypothetical protein
MNISFQLLLIAAALVDVNASSAIRGTPVIGSQEQGHDTLFIRHRHLVQNIECNLFKKRVHHLRANDNPNQQKEDSWFCALSGQDVQRLGVKFVEINESPDAAAAAAIANTAPGASFLFVSEALVDTNEAQIYIADGAYVEVMNSSRSRMNTGPPTKGTLQTLVVRVTDMNNVAPDLSIDELYSDIFDDDVCLKSQMDACSYGKLQIEPFRGKTPSKVKVTNGVVDVKMEATSLDDDVDNIAWWAAYDKLGDLDDSMFDLVMFIYPPGSYRAYAQVNDRYSWYDNDIVRLVAVQMHEVGHNLGLAHSGEDGDEYGDRSGIMGNFNWWDDEHVCYNSAKSYQLGWYSGETKPFNPLKGEVGNFVLHGISDYGNENHDNALVALRMRNFYVGYNGAEGIHADTVEDRNMVTIVRKEGNSVKEYGQSWKLASLEPGQHHTIQNYEDQIDVVVEFLTLSDGEARIKVSTCEDVAKSEKFQLKPKNSNSKVCKVWARKGKCDRLILVDGKHKGKLVWEVCAKSCERCV